MMSHVIRRGLFYRHGHDFEHEHGPHERHRHGRRHGPGGDWMRGWEGAFWGGFGREPGRRARRGDVKYLVLELLAEGPKHGYEIIRAIEERRGVRPSAGSVYPTLQLLEDGTYITGEQLEGKRVYTITEAGRAMLQLQAMREDAGGADDDPDEADELDIRHLVKQSAMKLFAAIVGARGSDVATLAKIRAVLDRARKEIYAILASDET